MKTLKIDPFLRVFLTSISTFLKFYEIIKNRTYIPIFVFATSGHFVKGNREIKVARHVIKTWVKACGARLLMQQLQGLIKRIDVVPLRLLHDVFLYNLLRLLLTDLLNDLVTKMLQILLFNLDILNTMGVNHNGISIHSITLDHHWIANI